jgi:hypothetical protein
MQYKTVKNQQPLIWIIVLLLLLLMAVLLYKLWVKRRWKTIAQLNKGLGISKTTVYIDRRGYLRWKESNRLCHRDIAWRNDIRGTARFGECDIHHKDENKLNNQPSNLEALTRYQHQIHHDQIIKRDGQIFIKLARVSKVYRETPKAYLIAHQWIPKSETILHNRVIYVAEWLYQKKGFG